jgi:hypothetical protein
MFFPTADLIESIRRHYDVYSELVPVCTAATALKAINKYFGTTGFRCDYDPQPNFF